MFTLNLNHFKFIIDKGFVAEQILTPLNTLQAKPVELDGDWELELSNNKILQLECEGSRFIISSQHTYNLRKGHGRISLSGVVKSKSSVKLPVLLNENYYPVFDLLDLEWEDTSLRFLKWMNINPKLILKMQQRRIIKVLTDDINKLLRNQYESWFTEYIDPILFGSFDLPDDYNSKVHYSLVGIAIGEMSTVGADIVVRAFGRALVSDAPFIDTEEHARFDLRRIETALDKPGKPRKAKAELILNKRSLSKLLQININKAIPEDLGFEISNIVLMKLVPQVEAAVLISGKQSGTLEFSFIPEFDLENQKFDIREVDILSRLDSIFANFLVNNFTNQVIRRVENHFPIKIDEILHSLSGKVRNFFERYPSMDLELQDFKLSAAEVKENQLILEFSSDLKFKIFGTEKLQEY